MLQRLIARLEPSNTSAVIVLDSQYGPGFVHIAKIHLSRQDSIGQAVIAAVGLLTLSVIVVLFAYLASYVLQPGTGDRRERSKAIHRFLTSDLGAYFICLMICDLTPTFGSLANIRWAMEHVIQHEPLCDFQGSMAQFGVIGGCAFNLILAVHTFLLLVLKVKPPPYVRYLFICGGWFIAVFLTILGPATNRASFSFYGPTNAGCWLTYGGTHWRQWYWTVPIICLVVLGLQIIIYVAVWLSLSGHFEKFRHRVLSGSTESKSVPDVTAERSKEVISIARRMLWFPILYAVFSLPIVMTVLLGAQGKIYHHTIYVVADALFTSLGIADTALFIITRKGLLLKRRFNTPSGIHMTIQRITHIEESTPGTQHIEYEYSDRDSFSSYNQSHPTAPRIASKLEMEAKRLERKSMIYEDGLELVKERAPMAAVANNPASASAETFNSCPWEECEPGKRVR